MTEAGLQKFSRSENTLSCSQDQIERLSRRRLTEILQHSGPFQPIVDYLLPAQGKMLRPKMVILSGQVCQAFIPWDCPHVAESLIDMAAACEMVHMASLVHDDVIDGSSQRRGLPTIHLVFGIHSAILTGDYLFTKAHSIALQYDSLGIPKVLNWAIESMCQGEVNQDERLFREDTSQEDYFSEISGKTAALFAASCRIGAMVARAPREVCDTLFYYGLNIGKAFQIIDDILDIVSSEKDLGKPICGDLKRGLATLPLILAIEHGYDGLREDFRQKVIPEKKVEATKEYILKRGYHRKAAEIAYELISNAEKGLENLPFSSGLGMLLEIGHQFKQRLDLITRPTSCHP